MLRLFIALPIPRNVSQEMFPKKCFPRNVSQQLQSLSGGLPGARWLPPQNYHLTLRFVGNAGSHQADDLDAALSLIGDPAVDVKLNGFSYFGKKGKANCLIATAERTPTLIHLQKKVERAMIRAGFEPEARKFSPHVTLARMKPVPEQVLEEYVIKNSFPQGLNWVSDRFSLYSSYLSTNGSIYTPEVDYGLSGGIDEDWAEDIAEEYSMDYTFNYTQRYMPEFA